MLSEIPNKAIKRTIKLKIAKPKSAAIGHMGLRLIKYGPEKAAKEVEDASKISCIAPKDGQKIEI